MTEERDPLRYRSPTLVLAVLGHIYDSDEPVPWTEIVEHHTDDAHTWRTVEGTLYDLVAFGAIHRIGKPGAGRNPDTRALKPTPLGRAWLYQEIQPLPGHHDPEQPET